jgi:serine/threonine protein kinase/tetratricopeptide (TPR) repeat protein
VSTPETIGPYRVLRPIATGGTAEVYEVQDTASGERLALKLLVAEEHSGLPGRFTQRFNREYEAMTRLNHPSIVRVYHYGVHRGQPWLTMELLRGQPAQAVVKRAGRPGSEPRNAEVLRVGYFVAQALHYIHDRNLVHRDLKSANVLVLPDERVKLLDFGAACLLDATERVTADGEFIGTFAYASPEQIAGRAVDGRSDLYSLGVLLYRLATGKRPFESDEEQELARMHLTQVPPDPREMVPQLPAALAEAIMGLLSKRPSERPPNAGALALRLEEIHERPFTTRSRLAIHESGAATRDLAERRVWEHLEAPGSSLILVDGDEGSDRMRFVDALHQESTDRGWASYLLPVGRGSPLQRLVDLLATIAVDAKSSEATQCLTELVEGTRPKGLASPTLRAQARAAAARIVRIRTQKAAGPRLLPVVLVIQELHRADTPTLELLSGLRRAFQGEDVPFKLVVGARSPDLDPGKELSRRLPDGLRVSLPPLSPREVALAVGYMLGRRPPPAEVARRLHEMSGGQPLYLEEAVADLVDLGGLEAEGNRLAWADHATEIPPPERAVGAALRLLDTLPFAARRVLEALAVAEDANEPQVLAKMLGWSVPELRVVLEKLVTDGVLRWRVADGIRPEWRHPMLQGLVLARVGPCRRMLLCRTLAEAASQMPPTSGAVKAMMAVGRHSEAVRAALTVGRQLLARSCVRTALSIVGPVVLSTHDRERSPELSELMLLYAHCGSVVQPSDPLPGRVLARAKQITDGQGDRVLIARAALGQARMFAALGHYANHRKELRRAWDAQSGQVPAVAVQIATELARSYRITGDMPKADSWIETGIVQSASASDDPVSTAFCSIEAATCALARGKLLEAEQSLARVMSRADRVRYPAPYWQSLARWATVLRHQARFSEALSQLYERVPEAAQGEDRGPYIELLLSTAWIELDLSRLGRAQECLDELSSIVSKGEHLHLRLETQLLAGRLQLASGQYRASAYQLQELHRGARQADLVVLAEQARALWAEALFALGDKEGASQAFQSAVLGLMGAGDQPILSEAVRGRARTSATERDPDEIFRPVQRLLDEQPMPLLRLEYLLARGAWHRSHGERDLAAQSLQKAAAALNKLAAELNDTDRAALRVHPWSAWIRRGLSR